MSTLDVVAEVLRKVAPRALKAREIAALAGERLPTASRTPETVVSRDLAIDVRDRGAASRFLRVDRGAFVLKEALPSAYYNDNDAYAAQWTRNLIAAGEIAAGVVDERSIRDLKPADVASYRQCHFFSGIGVWSRALRDGGWPGDVNVWSGSCPCQPLSQAGQRRGFADERHLWPEWFRLIKACRPSVLVGEQVSSKDGLAWLDLVFADLEGADYSVQAIDIPTASVGGPHARQRLYFVAYARDRAAEIVSASWLRAAADARAVADAREGRCEIVSTSWLHDRGQRGDDVARCGAFDGADAGAVSDAAGARPRVPQDVGTDRGDARESTEAYGRWSAGDLEPERGSAPDATGAVPDAERVVCDEGRIDRPHGWAEIEPDGHGEADGAIGGEAGGAGCDGDRTLGMGDTSLARGGRDTGALPRAQGVGEGERIEARDLADQPVAPGADDRGLGQEEVVRGAAHAAGDERGFRPGDRIRVVGDPSWGGAVRGYWARDVEWIYCRPEPGHQDGRWRPAESGTQPLVDGLAPGMGRTRAKRLRGFGNAIVLPLATVFVESVIDTFVDALLAAEVTPIVDAVHAPSTNDHVVEASVGNSAEESAA